MNTQSDRYEIYNESPGSLSFSKGKKEKKCIKWVCVHALKNYAGIYIKIYVSIKPSHFFFLNWFKTAFVTPQKI